MCEICLSTPCRPQCPNAPEPTPVLRCCKCKEEIFEGEPYLDSPSGQLCETCLDDMTVYEFLKFTEEKLSRAERSLYG